MRHSVPSHPCSPATPPTTSLHHPPPHRPTPPPVVQVGAPQARAAGVPRQHRPPPPLELARVADRLRLCGCGGMWGAGVRQSSERCGEQNLPAGNIGTAKGAGRVPNIPSTATRLHAPKEQHPQQLAHQSPQPYQTHTPHQARPATPSPACNPHQQPSPRAAAPAAARPTRGAGSAPSPGWQSSSRRRRARRRAAAGLASALHPVKVWRGMMGVGVEAGGSFKVIGWLFMGAASLQLQGRCIACSAPDTPRARLVYPKATACPPTTAHTPHLEARKAQPQLDVVRPLPSRLIELSGAPQQQLFIGLALPPPRRRLLRRQLGGCRHGCWARWACWACTRRPIRLLIKLQGKKGWAGQVQQPPLLLCLLHLLHRHLAQGKQPQRGVAIATAPGRRRRCCALLQAAPPALELRAALGPQRGCPKVPLAAVTLRVAVRLRGQLPAQQWGGMYSRQCEEQRNLLLSTPSQISQAATTKPAGITALLHAAVNGQVPAQPCNPSCSTALFPTCLTPYAPGPRRRTPRLAAKPPGSTRR